VNPPSSSSGVRLGVWLSILGAIAFSGKAIVVKLLLLEGVDAITALGLRMLLAAPTFAVMALWDRSRGPRPSGRDVGTILLLGVSGYYLASTLDFMGLSYVSASLERLILYAYPTIVLLIGRWRGQPPIRARQWMALGLSYAGVVFAFGGEARRAAASSGLTHDVVVGSLLVLASAASYAVYIAFSGEAVGRFGALRLTGWASGVASALCITQFFVLRPHLVFTSSEWLTPRIILLSVVNAGVCTAMPMWMVMRGIELLGSAKAAQIGLIGPLATLLLAVVFLGERLTLEMMAGTVLVLGGIALLARSRAAPPVAAQR
jgi:drug/metabolite transporter (DMT)-like permease